jgi:hypothetical protein
MITRPDATSADSTSDRLFTSILPEADLKTGLHDAVIVDS